MVGDDSGICCLVLISQLLCHVFSKDTYVLSRDCQIPPNPDLLLLYPNTKHLQIDNLEGGLVLYSHEGVSTYPNSTNISAFYSTYPLGFSCELVVHTPVENAKIMMIIESFYIPSNSEDCMENYLYVFDSNTAKSKAMPEAGGERGLCRSSYPRYPIFTTKSYICIVFHTSHQQPPIVSNQWPGFRVVLTAVRETTTAACEPGSFYCGSRPNIMISPSLDSGRPRFADLLPFGAADSGRSSGGRGSSAGSDSVSSALDQSKIGYCISDRARCDGVANCADGRDEESNQCKVFLETSANQNGERTNEQSRSSWISDLLSLGIPASIAIAVSTIVSFTVCIGAVICCCNRCCRPNSMAGRYSLGERGVSVVPLDPYGSAFTGGDGRMSGVGSSSIPSRSSRTRSPGRANLVAWFNGNRHVSAAWPPNAASYTTGYSHFSYGSPQDSACQMYPAPQRLLEQKQNFHQVSPAGEPTGQHGMLMRSTNKTSYSLGRSPVSSLGNEAIGLQQVGGSARTGTDSYSSMQSYTHYPMPPGPPPALVHGVMGSPVTCRRDASAVDPCCYTPPPYGACNVPPGSSMTASSSRTGTTSGGPVANMNEQLGSAWPVHRSRLQSETTGFLPASGSAGGGSNNELCATGSNGMLFGQQLSGGGNSALHTNTPVETISQNGGDLISNGGILYLGEVYQPNEELSGRFRALPCTPGSTTTGSGSSHGRKLHSCAYRRTIGDQQAHTSQLNFHSPPRQSVPESASQAYRRSRPPSHRQYRRKHHRSADPTRATSSGSHTPASSRSGLPTSCSQRSGEFRNSPQQLPQDTNVVTHPPVEQNPISFPVQL
ncbi:unnamed protein product [Calicophoron daubneyi]|uniref:CUB domain-containing protein n=1 Tax=Calicophoron daubneyi TaxID=300641 RepID=A0AAV2T4M9_CALDB